MAIVNRLVDYRVQEGNQGTALQGRVYFDDTASGPRPAVLVGHQWGGRDEFADGQAEALAKLGYVGFALDMYGVGVRGSTVAECSALLGPFLKERKMVSRRMQAAVDTVRALPGVDTTRVAAIGFCFGGLCVLDLARSGADVKGVVSFHGILKPPGHTSGKKLAAKLLVLHGDDDPLAPIEDFLALRTELSAAGADWQTHIYGHAKHAFAVPGADIPDIGAKHNASAERRSMQAMRNFLAEVLV